MENQPPVSCFCLTYGRPRVLEEAIHSFLRQDYAGPKEMIVLNDYADQILEFDHPEVQVSNLPKRFRTLGEKMNAAIALASPDPVRRSARRFAPWPCGGRRTRSSGG